MSREVQKKFEDYAYVLDYLARGKVSGTRQIFRTDPLVQLIGENYFTLLEATPRSGLPITLHERLYVGKELQRKKISHVVGRVNYEDLTSTAKAELPLVIETVVIMNQERFIRFFNAAQAITSRMHSLELIPGIGKKYTWTILGAREQKSFESYEDIKKRVGVPDPVKLITKRILEELIDRHPKYRLFTREF